MFTNKESSPLDRLILNSESKSSSKAQKMPADRFIPKKICANLYNLYFSEEPNSKCKENIQRNTQSSQYDNLLKSHLLGPSSITGSSSKNVHSTTKKKNKMIKFSSDDKSQPSENTFVPSNDIGYSGFEEVKLERKIAKEPYKILDAPGLMDDYYLNLMDWSSKNMISVGLENSVYFWSSMNGKVIRLCQYPDDNVCSVSWAQSGQHIAVGNTSGEVEVYDANKMT